MADQYEAKACFDTIKATLDHIQWKYDVKEEFLIATSAKGDNMAIPLFIGIDPDKPCIFIHSPLPFEIKESKMDIFTRAVCEVNIGMLIGNFDYDTKNNRIVFKETMPFMECLVSEAACKYMIMLACLMADKYNSKFFDLNRGAIEVNDFIEYVSKK